MKVLNFIVKGYIIALIISLISLFVYSVVLVNTDIQEYTIKPVVTIIIAISILIGSSISSMKIRKNGILNGFCVGGIYLLSLYVLSSIAITGFYLSKLFIVGKSFFHHSYLFIFIRTLDFAYFT